jgi:hypothetical protein
MSTFLAVLLPLLIVLAIFFAIYRSVRGKKSTELKRIGWLELLIAYLCVFAPIGLIMGLGKISPLFEKVPALNFLGTFDSITRLVLILASFYAGVCLWKTRKGAVRKAKIILAALLVFNVFVVKGIYSLAIYAALARADVSIPAKVLLDALTRDIMGSLVTAGVIVSWYIYLNRSRRVKEIYGALSAAQTIPPATEILNGVGTPVAEKEGTDV